jgi:hypothetical protein
MTPYLTTETLVHQHHQALLTEATRRRAARRARRFRHTFAISPVRAYAARALVRAGLRLAGDQQARTAATVSLQALPRSDGAIELGAPGTPRRRAA